MSSAQQPAAGFHSVTVIARPAPERVLVPGETALEIVRICDCAVSVSDIVDELARKNVTDMLQGLADKGFLVSASEAGNSEALA